MKILIIDNNIEVKGCKDFLRYVEGEALVRRGPEGDLPPDLKEFTHIIISGSRVSCLDTAPWIEQQMKFIRSAADIGTSILGVCFGHQIIARAYGSVASVRKSPTPEIGWVEVCQTAPNPILQGLPERFYSYQSHLEEVQTLPSPFLASATSQRCSIQAYHHKNLPIFGVQFHPERNLADGQASIDRMKKVISMDCIFNESRAKLVFNENVAITIFRNFLGIKRSGK